MNKLMLVLLLLFPSYLTALDATEDEAKKAKVAELMTVMDMESLLGSVDGRFAEMAKKISDELKIQPSEWEIFEEYQQKLSAVTKRELDWKKIQAKIAKVYTGQFNEQEITDLLAFYKTETGQSVLKKMPVVMQQSARITQGIMIRLVPAFQDLSKELKDNLEAHRNAAAKTE